MTDEDSELLTRLEKAAEEPFEGWDFSHLHGRMIEDPLPWNFERLVDEAVPHASTLLDMDTGGGEKLSTLAPLPPYAAATEGHPPNIPIVRRRLEPLGIQVAAVKGTEPLPFSSNMFDLITNRHGAFLPAELHRVLRPGGRFMTQQVGGINLQGLNRVLGAPLDASDWSLARARRELEEAGLTITQAEEAFPTTRFTEIEAVIYYLKAISWQIPDFTIDRYFSRLKALDEEMTKQAGLEVTAHRFLLVAVKPRYRSVQGG